MQPPYGKLYKNSHKTHGLLLGNSHTCTLLSASITFSSFTLHAAEWGSWPPVGGPLYSSPSAWCPSFQLVWIGIEASRVVSTLLRQPHLLLLLLRLGAGKCGVAVIRVSGSDARNAIFRLTKRSKLPEARRACLTHIIHPDTAHHIDTGILLWLPGPRSATGEDTCEMQVHGGAAVVSAVLSALSTLPNFRPAAPGEFTRRAFMAGRMDLTQVEGLADLINAETEQQRRQALLQMEGSLGNLYQSWRQLLIKGVAHLEAYIDLSEEENIEHDVLEVTRAQLTQLANDIRAHLDDGRRGELLKNGVRAVILGHPNVGKSSMLNLLVGRSAAIVTPVAGTTRDVIEVTLDLGGYPLVLADTAGQRLFTEDTTDPVEREGVQRGRAWASTADLAIILLDATQVINEIRGRDWDNYLNETASHLGMQTQDEKARIIVINKADLLSTDQISSLERDVTSHGMVCISCHTHHGIPDLITALTQRLQLLCGSPERESPWVTQTRHRQHTQNCQQAVAKCVKLLCVKDATHRDAQLPIAAHHARIALNQLGHITGHVTTHQILDVIFTDFCVGK